MDLKLEVIGIPVSGLSVPAQRVAPIRLLISPGGGKSTAPPGRRGPVRSGCYESGP